MSCLWLLNKFYPNKIQIVIIQKKARHFWKNMDSLDLHPPHSVKGMIELNRELFRKKVKIPRLVLPDKNLNKARPFIKKFLLKMEKLKPIRPISCNGGQNVDDSDAYNKEILLHPLAVNGWNSMPTEDLAKFDINESNFSFCKIELTYDNWRADEILKYVLPDDKDALTSFSRIGHIVHINLRDHLMPYKQLIGAILMDKVVGCRSVVNKAQSIDNTYRNFEVDLICGDPDYQVEVKENGVTFDFDFSKVYWNPRLSTEHERIVNILQPSDVLYDVFAGVGPFSIPAAAKRKCTVLANDLNPESYKWLNHNAKRNKCLEQIKTFNKDGRDFILEDVKEDLIKRYSIKAESKYNIHITMNLPAMAIEFLPAFKGLLSMEQIPDTNNIQFPLVHVYSFAKGDNTKALVKEAIETQLESVLSDNLVGIYFVRNVAPNKDMYRVSFYLTEKLLFSNNNKKRLLSDNVKSTTSSKKICS